MRMRYGVAPLSLLASAVLLASTAATHAVADEPVVDRTGAPFLWLDGPFGHVPGGSPDAPAGAPPGDQPLDMHVRDVPLSMEVDVPFEDVIAIEVLARSASDAGSVEVLSDGATLFDGPSTPGSAVIVATLETGSQGVTQHAWLVEVPDREYTQEALFEVSAPAIELVADAGTVIGAPGDGCYVYFCADTGELPPPQSLDALGVGVGETLAVRTDDGSGLAGWNGRLTPLDGTAIDSVEAVGALTDTVEPLLSLTGLEAPSRGQWQLEVRIIFDRERGHQWQIFRLDAR